MTTMDRLHRFIVREREYYKGEHNNLFAFSLGEASRYYRFLNIVYSRYVEVNTRYKYNMTRWMDAVKIE